MVQRERISCDLSERNALYLTGGDLGWCGMEKEAKARNRAGLSCEFLSNRELGARYGIDRTGGIITSGAAVADPVAVGGILVCTALDRKTHWDGK